MLAGLIVLMLVGLCVLLALLSLATLYWITHPPRQTVGGMVGRGLPTDPGEAGATLFDTKRIEAEDGVPIELWWVEGREASGPIVVILHGWGDSRMGALLWMRRLLPRVSRAVLFDLRGHGESRHRLCTFGAMETADVVRVVRWAGGLEPRRPVVLMGYSMGASIALRAARELKDEVGGVIADSPYRRSVDAVAAVLRLTGLPSWPAAWAAVRAMELRWPALRRGDAVEVASQVTAPVLVLHGSDDRITPAAEARPIADAAPQGVWCEIPGADHIQTAATDPRRCDAVIQQLLQRAAAKT